MPHLTELPFLIFDLQSSSTSPKTGAIIEIAWQLLTPGMEHPIQARLIALPQSLQLPKRVARLTGITPAMLEAAPSLLQAWAELKACLPAATRFIAHYARFERSFLLPALSETEHEAPPFICTHEIAKRLYPELPRKGLRALAGYLGQPLPALKRAAPQVAATAFIWQQMLVALAARGVTRARDLEDFLEKKPAPATKGSKAPRPLEREARLAIPKLPGVYIMRAADGRPLYIGKASNLHRRVNSYYQKRKTKRRQVVEMLQQVHEITTQSTAHPLEAALLEHDLIKRHDPEYNRALKLRFTELVSGQSLTTLASPAAWNHPIGPFPLNADIELAAALCQLGDDDRADTARQTILTSPRFNYRSAPTAEILDQALPILQQSLELAFPWRRHAVDRAAALAWYRWHALQAAAAQSEALAADADEPALPAPAPQAPEEGAQDQQDIELLHEWTPTSLARALEHSLIRYGRELRRSRWLRRLRNLSLSWESPAGPAGICLIHGERHAAWCGAPPRAFVLPQSSPATVDQVEYDRLCVLTTEIRGLIRRGQKPTLQLPQRRLSAAKLERILLAF